ncbi:hypothetical protein HMPREF3075_03795 [Clostridium sp. HMSC19B11]|nr:hypothetical protein HMPREF3075_03795 [Clostridium sp. HMSC19B11]
MKKMRLFGKVKRASLTTENALFNMVNLVKMDWMFIFTFFIISYNLLYEKDLFKSFLRYVE